MQPSIRFKGYQMKTLNLSRNCLTSMSDVGELTKLQEIDVSFNQLETLDGNLFREMGDLRRISLRNNKLKEIDLSFVTSTIKLVYLDISYNNLGVLRMNYTSDRLKEVHIEGNNWNVWH